MTFRVMYWLVALAERIIGWLVAGAELYKIAKASSSFVRCEESYHELV